MNLRDRWFYLSFKTKCIIIASVVLVLVIIGVIIILNIGKEEDNNVTPEVTPMPVESETYEPISQTDTASQENIVSTTFATVTDIRDLSTIYMIDVQSGTEDAQTSYTLEADVNTIFFDLDNKLVISPSSIQPGYGIVLYSSVNTNLGTVKAHFIGIGNDTSYTYDVLSDIKGSYEEGFMCSLNNTPDTLRINSETKVLNGYIGTDIPSMSVVKKGSKVLFKYDPNFEITASGNVYDCTEIVVFDN